LKFVNISIAAAGAARLPNVSRKAEAAVANLLSRVMRNFSIEMGSNDFAGAARGVESGRMKTRAARSL
jgi:hypothetical protein